MTTSTPKKGTELPGGWAAKFLTSLARWGNISAAAKAARVSRNFVYEQQKADPAFAAAWQEALAVAVEGLEHEAWRRGRDGVTRHKPIFYQGDQVGEERITEYSDTLLIFLLKAHKPEKYRDNGALNLPDGPLFKVYMGFDPEAV